MQHRPSGTKVPCAADETGWAMDPSFAKHDYPIRHASYLVYNDGTVHVSIGGLEDSAVTGCRA